MIVARAGVVLAVLAGLPARARARRVRRPASLAAAGVAFCGAFARLQRRRAPSRAGRSRWRWPAIAGLAGRTARGLALACGVGCALLRVEAWPFLLAFGRRAVAAARRRTARCWSRARSRSRRCGSCPSGSAPATCCAPARARGCRTPASRRPRPFPRWPRCARRRALPLWPLWIGAPVRAPGAPRGRCSVRRPGLDRARRGDGPGRVLRRAALLAARAPRWWRSPAPPGSSRLRARRGARSWRSPPSRLLARRGARSSRDLPDLRRDQAYQRGLAADLRARDRGRRRPRRAARAADARTSATCAGRCSPTT